ncbi:unnamed protein product [Anisakis simplex]|uniref:MHD1 domain-containing protein n=1 Tax=Anisakis simplex TaxID=6269 RepID=A0A0M3K4F7_ANISI|nr:unnamed protein product [Anisakis simplex]
MVRGCHRYVSLLNDLLNKADEGHLVDPTLMHYSFAFCASHVHGNRPDGVGTVTLEEKERFQEVLMKDVVSPVPPDEVRNVIRKCLEDAALVNYTRICNEAKLERELLHQERMGVDVSPQQRIEDMIRVTEYCIDLLKENEEHHGEAFAWFSDLLADHSEIFWSLFSVDLDAALEVQPQDSWDSFPLFQLLNDFLCSEPTLKNGVFHSKLVQQFSPLVVRYVDLMEHSISQSIEKGFAREKWELRKDGCATSEDIYWKLDALQGFVQDLNWPEEEFAKYLQVRMKALASEMISKCANCTYQCFDGFMQRARKSTDYVLPSEYKYQSKLDETLETMLRDMETCMQDKLLSVLEYVLSKLARYDEGNPIGALLSIAPKPTSIFSKMKNIVGDQSLAHLTGSSSSSPATPKPSAAQTQNSEHIGHSYVTFMRVCTEQLRQVVTDEVWKIYSDFELHGIDDERLNSKIYQSITRRLQLEEANCALSENNTGGVSTGNSAALIGNATQAVSSMGSMVEGAGARVFAFFK